MSDLKIAVPGLDYFTEQTTTQVPIALAAGTYTSTNNIMTLTTGSAHGLTFTPAANVMPNFFVQFGGSGYSAISGTGVLLGNTFRILSIPSTTTFTIYTTITSITATVAGTVIPAFSPVFQASLLSGNSNFNPNTSASVYTPFYGTVQCVNFNLGANCVVQYNSDNTFVGALDPTTGNTLATAPTFRSLAAASTNGQLRFGPQDLILASGSAGTTRISIVQ